MIVRASRAVFFFFNDTATTEIYTLSLHDALPIYDIGVVRAVICHLRHRAYTDVIDRKSTRLNSSHANISYAVFCLKKKMSDYLESVDSIFAGELGAGGPAGDTG